MAITSFKRYEKKFMLTQEQFNHLMPKLKEYMNEDEHSQDGGTYHIYNIYYDNETHDVIRHSISKPYYKEKLRLRSYHVVHQQEETVFLELKKKIDGVVNKRRVVLSLAESQAFLEHGIRPMTKNYMGEQVLNEIEYYLKQNPVQPKVYIAYERFALFGKDDRSIRITIDFNIVSRRHDLSLQKDNYEEKLLKEGMYLMEVKISDAIPIWLTQILSELSIYNSSFSKYGNEYQKYIKEINNRKGSVQVCYNPSYRQQENPLPLLTP